MVNAFVILKLIMRKQTMKQEHVSVRIISILPAKAVILAKI